MPSHHQGYVVDHDIGDQMGDNDLGSASMNSMDDCRSVSHQDSGAVEAVPATSAGLKKSDDDRQFVLVLTKGLMAYGSPSHQTDSYLQQACDKFNISCSTVLLPGVALMCFGKQGQPLTIKFVKAGSKNNLTSLNRLHRIFGEVMAGTKDVVLARQSIEDLLKEKPRYPKFFRVGLQFICATIVCSTAYSGAPVDMLVAGVLASFLLWGQMQLVKHHTLVFGNVFEITAAIIIAGLCKGLSAIPGEENASLFCYNAISSAVITSFLPGFVILTASIELCSKRSMIPGVLRLVYAMMYTLFLGFGLTFGSSIANFIPVVKNNVISPTSSVTAITVRQSIHGNFHSMNMTDFLSDGVTFTVSNTTSSARIIGGCLRPHTAPGWQQPLPWWSLLILVPIYTTCSSLKNSQNWRSPRLPAMVFLACLAYTANKFAHRWVTTSDVSAFAGALVLGIAANLYSWVIGVRREKENKVKTGVFTLMVTGVSFLVPSGLGQSNIFLNSSSSSAEYVASINLCLGIIVIASGVALGLMVATGFVIWLSWLVGKITRNNSITIESSVF